MKISVKSQSSSVTTPLPHRYHYVRASSGINKNQTGRTLDVANGYRVVSEQTHEKVTRAALGCKTDDQICGMAILSDLSYY